MLDSSVVGSRIVKRRAWTYIRCVGCAAAAFALFSGLALTQTNSRTKVPTVDLSGGGLVSKVQRRPSARIPTWLSFR